MEQNYYAEEPQQPKGSILTGLIGALLGALIGAVVWAAVGIALELIAGIVGALIAFLAIKGYDLLKGRPGVPKLVCVIIAVVLGVVIGTGVTYAWNIHSVYAEETAGLTAFQLARVMPEKDFYIEVLKDSEVQLEILKNLGIGLLFAAMCCFGMLKDIVAKPAPEGADISAAQVPGQEPDQPAAMDGATSSDDSASA